LDFGFWDLDVKTIRNPKSAIQNPEPLSQIPATLVETSTLVAPAMNPRYC
jgi:hypothetical protein